MNRGNIKINKQPPTSEQHFLELPRKIDFGLEKVFLPESALHHWIQLSVLFHPTPVTWVLCDFIRTKKDFEVVLCFLCCNFSDNLRNCVQLSAA
jgi:hypothetical protein